MGVRTSTLSTISTLSALIIMGLCLVLQQFKTEVMKQSFNELVEYYYEKKSEGMDFSQIRKELSEKNVDESQIKEIVREIDQKILKEGLKKKSKVKPRDLRLIGWVLMIVGGVLTFGIYFRMFDLKGYHFLSYGPVIIGYLLIVAARRAQRKS